MAADVPSMVFDQNADSGNGAWVPNPALYNVTAAPTGTIDAPVFGLPLYGGRFRPAPPNIEQMAATANNATNFKANAYMPWYAQQAQDANWLNKGFDTAKYFPGMNANAPAGAGQPRGTNLGFGGLFGYRGPYGAGNGPGIGIGNPTAPTIPPGSGPAPLNPFTNPGSIRGITVSTPVDPPSVTQGPGWTPSGTPPANVSSLPPPARTPVVGSITPPAASTPPAANTIPAGIFTGVNSGRLPPIDNKNAPVAPIVIDPTGVNAPTQNLNLEARFGPLDPYTPPLTGESFMQYAQRLNFPAEYLGAAAFGAYTYPSWYAALKAFYK
jgi:hypothetical protein